MSRNLIKALKVDLKTFITDNKTAIGYDPAVVSKKPASPSYPLIILTQVRNVPRPDNKTKIQRVWSVAYGVSVYVKVEPSRNAQEIAWQISEYVDKFFLDEVCMTKISENEFDEAEPKLYEIYCVYATNYFENKHTLV